MQTTKDYTCKLLLGTAWKVFFKKDFKTVFICEIIKIPGIGLSCIYNYYPCKDGLSADALHLLLRAMNKMLEAPRRPEAFSLETFISGEYHHSSMQELMSIVSRHREAF